MKEDMLISLKKFNDKEIKTEDIKQDIYKISLCSNIYDHRRRLLYKDVFDYFIENETIFKNIQEDYISRIIDNKLVCKYQIKSETYGIVGEIDLIDITNKTIIDYKCSSSNTMKLEWYLQLLTYLSLIKVN
jgi:hypothetical protein